MIRQAVMEHLATSRVEEAGHMLARAFYDDPMSEYLLPDREARSRLLPELATACTRYVHLYGDVYATANGGGAALWLRPGETELSYWRMLRSGMVSAALKSGLSGIARFLTLVDCVEDLHRRGVPARHWYLFFLGVEPSRQRQGIGSALIRPMLDLCDAFRSPCFLLTFNESTLHFYGRHGFRLAVSGKVPRGPRVWGLLREPRATWTNHVGAGLVVK